MISNDSYCLQMNIYWRCCWHFPIYIPAAHCHHLFHGRAHLCGYHDLDLDLWDALCFCYLYCLASLYFMNIKCTCTLYQHGLNILSVFIFLVRAFFSKVSLLMSFLSAFACSVGINSLHPSYVYCTNTKGHSLLTQIFYLPLYIISLCYDILNVFYTYIE